MSTRLSRRARQRPARALLQPPPGRPLLRAYDQSRGVLLEGKEMGLGGDRWVESFIEANRPQLRRLGVRESVETRGGVALRLIPSDRIGAIPLLSPANRRVVAGLLVEPRFNWSSLGDVLGRTGFATEPSLGGGPLVPGSAREVPSWLLAAPVLRRLERLLTRRKRGFVERFEHRQSPRGRVDWTRWAREGVPTGRWTSLPCHFPDPDDDPELLAAVRWTLTRLNEELSGIDDAVVISALRSRLAGLRVRVGPGPERRPTGSEVPGLSEWVAEALEAMGWVAEERGLGGSRTLDGMSWHLPINEVWEAWVDAFVADLAPRCGLVAIRAGETRRDLNWRTSVSSMRALIPDSGLRGQSRVVWIDAKYKSHLHHLSRSGWSGLSEQMQDAHRADLHQALAYASLNDAEQVDSILAYPQLSNSDFNPPAIANITAGRRRVRLLLLGLPFGFRSDTAREDALGRWREAISG